MCTAERQHGDVNIDEGQAQLQGCRKCWRKQRLLGVTQGQTVVASSNWSSFKCVRKPNNKCATRSQRKSNHATTHARHILSIFQSQRGNGSMQRKLGSRSQAGMRQQGTTTERHVYLSSTYQTIYT